MLLRRSDSLFIWDSNFEKKFLKKLGPFGWYKKDEDGSILPPSDLPWKIKIYYSSNKLTPLPKNIRIEIYFVNVLIVSIGTEATIWKTEYYIRCPWNHEFLKTLKKEKYIKLLENYLPEELVRKVHEIMVGY